MKPGISIIIPTYNREKFIKEAINSVLSQEYEGKIEIIISDDGSVDSTLTYVEEYGGNVTIVRKPDNCKTQGAASTRNRGIKASTQSMICFLDSDDFYLPGHLNQMILEFEKEPEIGFAFCRILEVKEEAGFNLYKPWTRKKILNCDIKNPVITRYQIVHTNSFMFRRQVFDQVGYFNETYLNGEDGDQWIRISEQFKGKFVDNFGATYRTLHGIEQLTKNPSQQINKSALQIFEEAKTRYYNLNLNDNKRIFKIKYTLIWLKFRKASILLFIFYYFMLILRYPTGFFQKLKEEYFTLFERRQRKSWNKLEKYIR